MTNLSKAAREALEALNAMLTHMGMDEDEWNKPTFNQARAALATLRAALDEAPQAEPVAEIVGGILRWHIPDAGWALPQQYLRGVHLLYAARPEAPTVALTEERPWVCRCGANLYIDADGKPRSKA